MKNSLLLLSAFLSFSVIASQTADPKAPKAPGENAVAAKAAPRVFFVNLKNGQTLSSKAKIQFGVEGMTVQPAGQVVTGTGHHHLIIDGDAVPSGQVVPADANHIHFGKGQTEVEIELKPGKHKLVLQFANGAHLSYGPELAAVVDVIVK